MLDIRICALFAAIPNDATLISESFSATFSSRTWEANIKNASPGDQERYAMAALLSCENIRYTLGARTLFDGIQFSINEGDRVGMIGPNGAGKSTLAQILAGVLEPSDGTRVTRKNLRLGWLSQTDAFESDDTVRSALMRAADSPHEQEHEQIARVEAWISKLEFSEPDRPVLALSGGWRKRLSLACVLLREPELLLFDEPTNHLDMEGIAWLEKVLPSAALSFLVISHDRYLLENICNRIIELNPQFPEGSFQISGAYSKYLEKREEFLAGQAKQQQTLENKVRREIEWLKRGPKARTTKAKYRIDEAGRMMQSLGDLQTRNSANKRVNIEFTATDRRSNHLVQLKNVSKSLGGRCLFQGLNLFLERGQRLGILGSNGTGKSTLLRLMTRDVPPDEGTVITGEGIRVVYFDQSRAQLDPSSTLRESLAPTGDEIFFQGRSIHVESWAKRFLFRSEQLNVRLGDLSGGEQARVLLAKMMLAPADVLLLDEPTNDLDIPSLEMLEASLCEFPGAVVLITHDRYLLEKVSNSILGLDGGGGFGFYVDYEQWMEAKEAASERQKAKPTSAKPAIKSTASKSKGLSFKEKNELAAIEPALHEAEKQAQEIQARLADPTIMADHVRLNDECMALEQVQAHINQLFTRWEELEAKQNGG